MRNQLESKTGLIKSINAKNNDGMGLGQGTGGASPALCRLPYVSFPNPGLCPFHSRGQKYVRLVIPSKGLWQPLLAVGRF